VAQHAAAAQVSVALERSGSSTLLRVSDDGRGFDPAQVEVLAGHAGFGLTSMRERVQGVGGRLTVDSGPGRGTRVEARVPAGSPPVDVDGDPVP
jgi:signal transduction histidine kinase